MKVCAEITEVLRTPTTNTRSKIMEHTGFSVGYYHSSYLFPDSVEGRSCQETIPPPLSSPQEIPLTSNTSSRNIEIFTPVQWLIASY